MTEFSDDNIDALHAQACSEKAPFYIDPVTSYRVFTSVALERFDRCCGSGCRHCPYDHQNVDVAKRIQIKREPSLQKNNDRTGPCDLLFWSGGKDSYLALRALQEEGVRDVVLVTSFSGADHRVAHQEIPIECIEMQAKDLGLDLLLLPLYPNTEYASRVWVGTSLLQRQRHIKRMVFGDLHLEHIRGWREKELSFLAPLYFPLWKADYTTLQKELFSSSVQIFISAITDERCQYLSVGKRFDADVLKGLPSEVDNMGENGEFHTCVWFRSSPPILTRT
jgi:ATP-binding cassette subfamily B (MDR/TAP) protein 1